MTRWSLKHTCQLPRVCSPVVALIHTKGPRHKRKICANSLGLYSNSTQTSPSKNKNINYIFIYLRGLRCLSRGTIYNTGSIFKRSFAGLNWEFSFSLASFLLMSKESNMTYHLPQTGGRIIGFILFPMVLVPWEMQTASSKIWTRVTVSIYDDNSYRKDINLRVDLVAVSM